MLMFVFDFCLSSYYWALTWNVISHDYFVECYKLQLINSYWNKRQKTKQQQQNVNSSMLPFK